MQILVEFEYGVPILIGTYWVQYIEFGLSFFSDMVY